MAPPRRERGDCKGEPTPVEWPNGGIVTHDWVKRLRAALEHATRSLKPTDLPTILSVSVADQIIGAASKLLHREPNCLDIVVSSESEVVLVGDVHGQFHDVLHLLDMAGDPSSDRVFIFNGDYVDRGAWGLETYVFLLSWKILLPYSVFLLRGNHETKFCTSAYGFEQEVMTKYGDRGRHVYRKVLGCFEGHPLAARVAGCVYLAHGGLFRFFENQPTKKKKFGRRLLRSHSGRDALKLGTLNDLQRARRGVLNPSGFGSNAIPADVLWSDPSSKDGLTYNNARGIGLLWGPDCTQEFMEKNKIKLIVRSHEGPDAREKREDMAPMDKGYTIDHVVKAGKLITLFSAPDYPQFQASTKRYRNKGAYITLHAPTFWEPRFHIFDAVYPRPKVSPYYDFENSLDSDEELDMGAASSEGGSGSDG